MKKECKNCILNSQKCELLLSMDLMEIKDGMLKPLESN